MTYSPQKTHFGFHTLTHDSEALEPKHTNAKRGYGGSYGVLGVCLVSVFITQTFHTLTYTHLVIYLGVYEVISFKMKKSGNFT